MAPPTILARNPSRELPALRVLVYMPGSSAEAWILSEVSRVDALVQVARNLNNVIAALVEDPPPRPAVVVVDFDRMNPGELLQLHSVRERGWCGVLIGLGMIPLPLRASLGIERVVVLPAKHGALTDQINAVGFTSQTVRIPVRRDLSTVEPFKVRATNARVATRQR